MHAILDFFTGTHVQDVNLTVITISVDFWKFSLPVFNCLAPTFVDFIVEYDNNIKCLSK